MDAGRELDALVAEKVMGTETPKWLDVPNGLETLTSREIVPLYSTDIAAAWQVVERMRVQGFEFALIGDERGDDGSDRTYAAEFDKYDGNIGETTYLHGARAQRAPHAICLAALKACGVED